MFKRNFIVSDRLFACIFRFVFVTLCLNLSLMKNLFIICFALVIAANITSCKKTLTNSPVSVDSLKVGLIAYYPFNNNGVDSSGNGNNATVFNVSPSTDRFGKANYAYSFNGTTSYAAVADNAALRLSNTDFTVSTWVNMTAFNSTSGSFIFAKRTSGLNDGWGFSITGYQSGTPIVGGVFFGPGGGNPYAVGTKSLVTGKWNMVTVVYNLAKQQVSIYENGVLDNVTNNIATPNAAINANLYIGTDNPINATSYFMNGAFNDMRIYNRALSSSLVQQLYLSVH